MKFSKIFWRMGLLLTAVLLLNFFSFSQGAEIEQQEPAVPVITHWKKSAIKKNPASPVFNNEAEEGTEGLSARKLRTQSQQVRLSNFTFAGPPTARHLIITSLFSPDREELLPCMISPILYPVHWFW